MVQISTVNINYLIRLIFHTQYLENEYFSHCEKLHTENIVLSVLSSLVTSMYVEYVHCFKTLTRISSVV